MCILNCCLSKKRSSVDTTCNFAENTCQSQEDTDIVAANVKILLKLLLEDKIQGKWTLQDNSGFQDMKHTESQTHWPKEQSNKCQERRAHTFLLVSWAETLSTYTVHDRFSVNMDQCD